MVKYLKLDLAANLPDATDAEISLASGMQRVPDANIKKLRQTLADDPMTYSGRIALAQAESRGAS